MAWEPRGNDTYYYRKQRRGKRVESVYIGNDGTAHVIAELDRVDREKLRISRQIWRDEINEFKELEPDFELLMKVIHGLTDTALLSSGYHPHKGQWRKKRNG
jgi:hypothetical protein